MNRARAESGEVIARPAVEGTWLTLAVLGVLPPAVTRTRLLTWTLPADMVQWQGDKR